MWVKAWKKYKLFGCSSVHINITEENEMQSHAHLCGTEAMLRYSLESKTVSSPGLTNQFKSLQSSEKYVILFAIHGPSHCLSQESDQRAAQHMCCPALSAWSLLWLSWMSHLKKKKKQRRLITGQNANSKNSNTSAGLVIEHSRRQSFEARSNTVPQRQQMLCSACGPPAVTSSVHSGAPAHWQFVVFRQVVEMLVHIRYKFGTHLKGISLPAVDTQQKM